jgi:biopolymer transport protein ExbD
MKFPRNAKIYRGQLDLAPLAGVFFLLMIFFLLNSSLVFTPGVPIQLPSSGDKSIPGLAGPSVVVAMDGSGQLFFENQVISFKDLQLRLQELADTYNDLTLVLQADKAVRMEGLLQLSQVATEAGIRHVWLAAQPPSQAHAILWQKSP